MRLRILSGELKGQIMPLHRARLQIGRAKENDLILPDSEVSRYHAHLFNQDNQWFMKSITPNNPLYEGERRHTRTFNIEPGMIVRIGNTLVQFEATPIETLQEPTPRSPILPVLLGAGVGILILGVVLLLATNNMLGPTQEQIAATNTQIALANATATPTVTQTPIPTATFTPLPTATAEPTMTPVPLLQPQLGEITPQDYSPELLDPNLLEGVTWSRDLLFTVPIFLTNHTTQTIPYNDIQVGLFAQLDDQLIQVPSFFLNDDDGVDTIAPNETRRLRWQIVLPNGVPLHAWKVIYKDIEVQEFLHQ